uniref:FAS1 domain-containing protein n=1 Tax=Anopheles atroparvus TaxID=41427 RepID=A0AAG5D0W5_ANOAO
MASSVKRKVGCKWRISVVVGLIVGVCLREPTVCASEDDPPAISYINSEAMGLKILPDLASVQLDENIPEQYRVAANGIAKLWKEHLSDFKGYISVKDTPFTLIVPDKIDEAAFGKSRPKVQEFLFDHVVPGALVEIKDQNTYINLNQRPVHINLSCVDMLMAYEINQSAKVLTKRNITENLSLVFIVGNLTDSESQNASTNTKLNKRNIQENNRYNEPQRLEMKNVTKEQATSKENRIGQHLMNFLAGMKSGTKVFQHFFTSSNLSQLMDDSAYMVFIPSDTAFQRWHPIDWGFYPFSVQEFTETVLQNHLVRVKQPLRMADLRSTHTVQRYKTLGGETVVLKSKPTPNVNNVTILSDYTLSNGIEVFILSEVLFVSEAVVSRLHQMHKDKETPPLLAFPWFGAQFLSHSFLALERDTRFTQITRFLNTAEIAQFISGSNYTFFVPTDEAFERYSFDLLPDSVLASEKGIKMLLNHFVRGRLYDRDLKNGEVIDTIGEMPVKIQRSFENVVRVNSARIVESEVFVYNLGTMFYVNDVLYPHQLMDEVKAITDLRNIDGNVPDSIAGIDGYTTEQNQPETDRPTSSTFRSLLGLLTTSADVELVPVEVTERGKLNSNEDGPLLHYDEIITPKALPMKYFYEPKK